MARCTEGGTKWITQRCLKNPEAKVRPLKLLRVLWGWSREEEGVDVGRGDEQGGGEATRLMVRLQWVVGAQLWTGVSGETVCFSGVWASSSRIGLYLGMEVLRYLVLSGVSFCPDQCLLEWRQRMGSYQ